MIEARKISFQEAWDSSVIFLVDGELERELEAEVETLLETARDHRVSETVEINVADIADFLNQKDNALDVILKDIGLPEEEFKCTVLLLRKLRRIPGEFDGQWSMREIKSKLACEPDFARMIAELLVDGKRDRELKQHVPRHYLDMLNYREIKGISQADRRKRYKESLIGTYEERKKQKVEERIRAQLEEIKAKHGLPYIRVHPVLIKMDIGLFAVPSFEDAWVVIVGSFQENMSIEQITEVDYMMSAYERVCRVNSRYGENRAFVNFADGGGWLARKRDLERLVEHCHYFINLQHLDMLKAIVLQHVPERYFT
ncbi:MAG: hypothetical protein H8E40_12055 [Chloroflexi bacterium]|nr:hypothetical protein [Chloroflexota bacterium]